MNVAGDCAVIVHLKDVSTQDSGVFASIWLSQLHLFDKRTKTVPRRGPSRTPDLPSPRAETWSQYRTNTQQFGHFKRKNWLIKLKSGQMAKNKKNSKPLASGEQLRARNAPLTKIALCCALLGRTRLSCFRRDRNAGQIHGERGAKSLD